MHVPGPSFHTDGSNCVVQAPNPTASIEAALEHLPQQVHRLGSCSGASQAPSLSLPDTVEGQAQLVLVCGPEQDVPASMQLLQDVAALVEGSGRSHAFLFVGRPQVIAAAVSACN